MSFNSVIQKACTDHLKTLAGNIPVHEWGDQTQKVGANQLVVHCHPAKRIAPNYPMHRANLDIGGFSKTADDKNRALITSMEDVAQSFIESLFGRGAAGVTAINTLLTTANAGIKIDGVVPDSGDHGDISDFQESSLSVVINFSTT